MKLGEDFDTALRHYRKHNPRHLPSTELVRRALICYWTQQKTREGVESINLALHGVLDTETATVSPD